MLSPNQIQKLLNQYLVADYEQPINGEIMKAVASRVTEKSDVLLLTAVDMEDSGAFLAPNTTSQATCRDRLSAGHRTTGES